MLETCSSEEILNKPSKIYNQVLKESGFTDDLKYSPNEVQQLENKENKKEMKRKKKKKKIIWFSPPYSKNVKTSLGKVFLNLLKKHSPASHILQKIFNNKNTAKIAYSCIKKYQLCYFFS